MLSLTPAFAISEYLQADVKGLTETQKAELQVSIAKLKEKAKAIPVPKVTAAEVKEYSALVNAIGTVLKIQRYSLG